MEQITTYIIKSAIWITAFSLIYYLFLLNDRFFIVKRIYLISGLLASFIFPLITIRYAVNIQVMAASVQSDLPSIVGVESSTNELITWKNSAIALFTLGVLILLIRLSLQSFKIVNLIRNSEKEFFGKIKVIRNATIKAPFSFFSFVFVNSSTPEKEKREIVTHEAEHIKQHHWIDLVLTEILCMMQWFNPIVWFYGHFVRQNHEYLADQRALLVTDDPVIYKAVLLNQLMGGEAIRLGHPFSYSLNKKRFIMMKNTSVPAIKKFKPLLIIPAIAFIFYAFAKPEYKYVKANNIEIVQNTTPQEKVKKEKKSNSANKKTPEKIKGVVVQEDGKPLAGTSIIVVGTQTGTVSNDNGHFELINIGNDKELAFSFVGFKTIKAPASSGKEIKIVMLPDTIIWNEKKEVKVMALSDREEIHEIIVNGDNNQGKKTEKIIIRKSSDDKGDKKPIIIKNGKEISAEEMETLHPGSIEKIHVIKGPSAKEKYGDNGTNGVVEIIVKEKIIKENTGTKTKSDEEPVFFVVEDMPKFPGGDDALKEYLITNVKYPEEAKAKGITGKVFIQFVISEVGKVGNLKVLRSVHPLLDLEAWRVIENMPDWKPGTQRGKNVKVSYIIPVNFNLEKEEKSTE